MEAAKNNRQIKLSREAFNDVIKSVSSRWKTLSSVEKTKWNVEGNNNLFYFFACPCVKLEVHVYYIAEKINAVRAKKEKDDTTEGLSVHVMFALLLVSELCIYDTNFFLRVMLF